MREESKDLFEFAVKTVLGEGGDGGCTVCSSDYKQLAEEFEEFKLLEDWQKVLASWQKNQWNRTVDGEPVEYVAFSDLNEGIVFMDKRKNSINFLELGFS
jgi:hypothetical protein